MYPLQGQKETGFDVSQCLTEIQETMMSNISNGGPRYILNGIRDDSMKAPVPVPEEYPQNLPHIYLLAERGDLTPQLIDPILLTTLYGSKTFNSLSKYFTMGSVYANIFSRVGNMMLVQRVHPEDALKPAMFTLGIEIVKDKIPDIQRDDDGDGVRDKDGNYILTGDTRDGYIGRLVINRDVTRAVGAGEKAKGEMTSSTGVQSDFYPIMDLEVPSPGEFGNNVGLSIWAPNAKGNDPLNVSVAVDQAAQLYRMRLYERPDIQSTPVVKLTQGHSAEIDFSFRRNVVDKSTEFKYDLNLRIRDYANEGDDGTVPMPGPLTNYFLYEKNLDTVLNMLYKAETDANETIAKVPNGQHQINFISALDFNGFPYYTFRLQGIADGGINMNDVAVYYAEGGSDGEMSEEVYDKLCRTQFENYGYLPGIEMLDEARYPVSSYWDANYSIETKKAMISLLGKRKDIGIYGSTSLPGRVRLSAQEQRSLGAALRTYAQLFPESTLYGTGACRFFMFMQSGQIAGDDSDAFVPHLIDHAYKRARYAGSADGVLKNEFAYDAAENNKVQLLKNMDVLWEPNEVRNKNWSAGLNYAMTHSRRYAYVPHVQSIYEHESSTIRDEIAVTICIDLEKKCQQAYKMLGVDTRRTTAQNLSRLKTILEDLTKDKYDNRVIIDITAFRTIRDINSRVRYSCEVSAAFNKGMYIGSFTVVSRNQEDLE